MMSESDRTGTDALAKIVTQIDLMERGPCVSFDWKYLRSLIGEHADDLASLAARWREKAEQSRNAANLTDSQHERLIILLRAQAIAIEECADDLAALRIASHEGHETTNGKIGEALGLSGNILCVPKDDEAPMRQLKVTEEALVASRQECQELSAAVTTSDLDHASVVLVARANAQDSEIVEAVKASAEEARETQEQARVERLVLEAEAINAKVQQKYAAQLREQQERADQAESALAAARRDAEQFRAALTELKNAAADSLRTTGQRAGVPMFVPSVAKRVLAIVGPPLAASGSQREGDCLAPLVPLPEAAARLRATPQEKDDKP